MTRTKRYRLLRLLLVTAVLITTAFAFQASQIATSHTMMIDDLVKILNSSKGEKPLLIHVGSHVLYAQAHIPNSEYIGPASDPSALQRLRARVVQRPHQQPLAAQQRRRGRHPARRGR